LGDDRVPARRGAGRDAEPDVDDAVAAGVGRRRDDRAVPGELDVAGAADAWLADARERRRDRIAGLPVARIDAQRAREHGSSRQPDDHDRDRNSSDGPSEEAARGGAAGHRNLGGVAMADGRRVQTEDAPAS
jgi:hypothetical protein